MESDKSRLPRKNYFILGQSATTVQQRLTKQRLVSIANDDKKLLELEQAMKCVSCAMLPNPEYYLVCQENGHHLCGFCAWKIRPLNRNRCCEPDKLKVGNQQLFEGIIKGSVWRSDSNRPQFALFAVKKWTKRLEPLKFIFYNIVACRENELGFIIIIGCYFLRQAY